MNIKKTRVLVLKGGWSSERSISLASGRAVEEGLMRAGFRVSSLDLRGIGDIEKLFRKRFDAAFIALHGKFGEDGGIQAVLEGMGAAYTGSGALASALAMNKIFAKKIFILSGIPTPRFHVINKCPVSSVQCPVSFSYPVVVKPSSEGSAIGVSIAANKKEYSEAVRSTLKFGEDILIEEYIEGREFSVGILDAAALAVVELKPKRRFYDYKAKYSPGFCEHTAPAKIAPGVYRKIQNAALEAHFALGCGGYSRVDVRMGKKGIFVLEVNTIPGMLRLSLFPESARAAGIGFEKLLVKIVGMAKGK